MRHARRMMHHASILNPKPFTLMNMTRIFPLIAVAALFTMVAFATAAEPVKVFLLDDQTDDKLATVHGIEPVTVEGLGVLVNGVLQAKGGIHLFYQMVDEDASDNPTAILQFKPFERPRPQAPGAGLPVSVLTTRMRAYQTEMLSWKKAITLYRQTLVTDAEAFVRKTMDIQMEVMERFAKELERRNGADYNRSSVAGCVVHANRLLGTRGKRFLLINCDAEDLPMKEVGKPRTIPFTPVELDSGITLIFINTSRLPEDSPLFKGVANHRHSVEKLTDAYEIILGALQPEKGE